jgi:hypothetical protein
MLSFFTSAKKYSAETSPEVTGDRQQLTRSSAVNTKSSKKDEGYDMQNALVSDFYCGHKSIAKW